MSSQETRAFGEFELQGAGWVDRLQDKAAGVEGPTMGGGWPRTCPFLRLGKLVVALRAGPSTGCGVPGRRESAESPRRWLSSGVAWASHYAALNPEQWLVAMPPRCLRSGVADTFPARR